MNLYNCAISNYNGIIKLGNNLSLGNSMTRRNQGKNLFEIECYTLSKFCELNINKVDFLKVDIEGSEEDLFQDINFFDNYRPTVFIQLHYGWFLNKKSARDNFKKITRLYKYLYDENLNRIYELNENISTYVLSQELM